MSELSKLLSLRRFYLHGEFIPVRYAGVVNSRLAATDNRIPMEISLLVISEQFSKTVAERLGRLLYIFD